MTVGYLMDHISFDEMVPHLISMIRDPEKDLYSIREDFDLINATLQCTSAGISGRFSGY